MTIRTSPLLLKQNASSDSKRISPFRIGAQILDTIVSLVLSAFAAVFFAWLNGQQQEFEQLQDKRQ